MWGPAGRSRASTGSGTSSTQGPHQVAQKSMSTGLPALIVCSNVPSVRIATPRWSGRTTNAGAIDDLLRPLKVVIENPLKQNRLIGAADPRHDGEVRGY